VLTQNTADQSSAVYTVYWDDYRGESGRQICRHTDPYISLTLAADLVGLELQSKGQCYTLTVTAYNSTPRL